MRRVPVSAAPEFGAILEGLTEALRSREVIAHAQGILIKRDGMGASEGCAYLRVFYQRTNRPIRQPAEEMVIFTLGQELGRIEIMEMRVE
jgi:AmiR/NasT family two-component response regulator